MTNVLAQSLAYTYEIAFRELDAALVECPDELWETDLWPDEAPTAPHEGGALRGSAPWILVHHALVCLDYDLTGDFEMWAPPSPIGEFTLWSDPTRLFTKPELRDYLEFCRERVRQIAGGLTEELAARPLPATHRYAGTPYGVIVASMALHLVEHATQIRQFLRHQQRSHTWRSPRE